MGKLDARLSQRGNIVPVSRGQFRATCRAPRTPGRDAG
jgi:hypothetical protein